VAVPLRILVVEDDAMQRNVLRSFLRANAFYVETASDGLEALRKARVGWFDVVLMDHQLPELDGLTSARLLADLTNESKRPWLIGLSASHADLLAASDDEPSVFDAVLRKPWSPETLLETIRRCHDAAPERRDHKMIIRRTPTAHIFRADFPVPPPAPDPEQPAQPKPGAVRILVVDDDEMFRALLSAALRGCDYDVETASGGREALEMVRKVIYDVALLDYSLPDLDGVAIAKLMFELLRHSVRPRLIALTATPDRVAEREAASVSAFDEVISKSAGLAPVLSMVMQCAAYRRSHPQPSGINVPQLCAAMDDADGA
jgi:CheY-like chemotaxis protein